MAGKVYNIPYDIEEMCEVCGHSIFSFHCPKCDDNFAYDGHGQSITDIWDDMDNTFICSSCNTIYKVLRKPGKKHIKARVKKLGELS